MTGPQRGKPPASARALPPVSKSDDGDIAVVATLEEARIPWLPHFVRHYQALGLRRFALTIQCPEGRRMQGEKARRRAMKVVRPLGVRDLGLLERDYDAMALRAHHDEIQQRGEARWYVWADLDEFQVYPRAVPDLVGEWEEAGTMACRGVFVDRIGRNGELVEFDESRPVWGQFPLGATVTRDIVGGDISKVVCARASVRIGVGNHHAIDAEDLQWARETIAVHHFKWDSTVNERLALRLTDAWKDRCPWWTHTARLRRVLDFNQGRIPVHAVSSFDFKDDARPLENEPYLSNKRYREWDRTGRLKMWDKVPTRQR